MKKTKKRKMNMTVKNIAGALWIPWLPSFTDEEPAYGISIMDASTERVAIILRITQDGTLDGFEYGQLQSVASVLSRVKYSFQDLDSNGKPDGIADQYRIVDPTFGALDWQQTGILSSDGTDTGTKRVVTRNQLIACVIEWSTFVALDKVNVRYIDGKSHTSHDVMNYTGGAWSEVVDAIPAAALKYNDGTYPYLPGCFPALTTDAYVIGDGSNQAEWGMAVTFPAPVRVKGVVVRYSTLSSTSAKVTLYDKNFYSILEQVDLKLKPDTSRYQNFVFQQSVDPEGYLFDANEVYRIVISVAVGDTVSGFRFVVDNTNLLNVMGGGTLFHQTLREGAVVANEAWVDDLTIRPLMSLMVTGIDHQTGGGG